MRGLDTNMKAEFIRQNKSSTNLPSSGSQSGELSRPATGKRSKTDDVALLGKGSSTSAEGITNPKRASRPRSLTFTLKDKSLSKKKSERSMSHARNKSVDITKSASSKTVNTSSDPSVLGFFGLGQKTAVPLDFVTYLRKVQKPQLVEVGKLQKLRQLLRNETVTWTDSFVEQGGMTEIVGLLYRIIDIEWRCVDSIPSYFHY